MPVYLTQTLLDSLAEHTEAFLQKAVSEWQMLPPADFARQPASGKWSANQCLTHLNQYGRYYLPLMETAIDHAIRAQQKPSVKFTAGWLGHYFTKMMLNNADGTPVKKMSAPKSYDPVANDNSHEVIAEFIEQQERLLLLLQKAKQVDLATIRIPISIAKFIKLKLGDTFLFLIAHNYRHILQAGRALGKDQKKLHLFTLEAMQNQ